MVTDSRAASRLPPSIRRSGWPKPAALGCVAGSPKGRCAGAAMKPQSQAGPRVTPDAPRRRTTHTTAPIAAASSSATSTGQ